MDPPLACDLCGGSRWETLEEATGTRVVRCACGLVFVVPQPPRAALEQAYDETYYQPWERQARLRGRIWRDRVDRVAALAAPPGRLLDVGCGTGAFLVRARERGWDVAGTELSHAGAQRARADGLTVVEGEIWEAGFPQDVFHVVTCWHVIEHVGAPRQFLGEIHRILRPGGWLVLATPNLEDRIFRAAYILARRRRPRLYEPGEREVHLYVFSESTLRRLLVASGFEEISIEFDRGAAAVWGKRLANELAYAWYRLTGINWGMALQGVSRKTAAPASLGREKDG